MEQKIKKKKTLQVLEGLRNLQKTEQKKKKKIGPFLVFYIEPNDQSSVIGNKGSNTDK